MLTLQTFSLTTMTTMDVDAEHHTRKSPFIHYFDISNNFPWREPRPEEIERRRALLGDVLIYDILLSSGGIKDPDLLYPPRDETSLQRLLQAIEGSHYDALKKDCLVYFLLKWHQDGREDRFQEQRSIPPQFAALATAYWHLDSGINVARAVSLLSDARLNRDYASKILQAISLSPQPEPLIRKYIRTAQPPLTEPVDLDIYTVSLADSSLLEAWQFQRTFIETQETRPRLFKKILEWCLTPSPRPTALTQLLALPLSNFEQSLLHLYALEPPAEISASAIAVLQDLVCVRLIQGGKYAEVIKIDRQFSSSTPGGKNTKQAQDRRKMVQDLYTALPDVERALIDAELESLSTPPITTLPSQNVTTNGDVSMSQSWEDVRPDIPSAANQPIASTSSPFRDGPRTSFVPISERSRGPRFGGSVPSPPASKNPPILPITPSAAISAPRKSFPLPTIPLSTLGPSKPRQSLSGAANGVFLNAGANVTSPASGMKFSTTSNNGQRQGHAFTSTTRTANAFYQPPTKTNGVDHRFGAASHDVQPESLENAPPPPADVYMVIETDNESAKEDGHKSGGEDAAGLGYSVFGNGNGSVVGRKRPAAGNAKPASASLSASTGKRVPGAFTDDEEADDDEPEEEEEETRRPPARRVRSRQSSSNRSAATSKPSTRTRQTKRQEKRTVPGGLTDDDAEHGDREEEEEEEEEEDIAPLRAPSPRRPLRKARSSAGSDIGENEGVKTRRSSRLSHTSAPEHSPERPARPRKSTRGATKKKR
ncbi:nuclear pore complex assembly-domain-containing protein [Crucibulum laeve]|uniref:Nuclear pore complex assembly-domain-containing protein n=1 Tax=Crucibulum laeve TaxID=68775 RepID=A0A5C3LZK4_9AGAR|nr:nuclear pore complex assembly-domain-containing protein [Crucibulum laeve]